MIRQTIRIPTPWNWIVVVYYSTGDVDEYEVLRDLRYAGCEGEDLADAKKLLSKGMLNDGITYSNPATQEAVVVIGPTTSAAQFQDTFDHEKGHLAQYIGKAMRIDPYGEEFGYLNGMIGHLMFPMAQRFLCDCCRRKRKGR